MKIAVIQMSIDADPAKEISKAEHLITKAAKRGAKLIILPELFPHMWDIRQSKRIAETRTGPSITAIKKAARENKVTIIAGSIFEKKGSEPPLNSSFVINGRGQIIAKYSKLHLFDFIKPGEIEYHESKHMSAGKTSKDFKFKKDKIGLAICNDLRYPELFRKYAKKDCFAVALPSAFTRITGEAHWELLLRARAAENQMYIFAANRSGENLKGNEFYGHSMIIDPWGTVIDRSPGFGNDILIADVNPKYVLKLRKELPTLKKARSKY